MRRDANANWRVARRDRGRLGSAIETPRGRVQLCHCPSARVSRRRIPDASAARAGETVDDPIAVGELLSDDGQPSTVVVAGVLHDVLEDTDVTLAELHKRFGPDIARLAEALTQDTAIMKYGERKAALRRQILDVGPEAAIVSLADKAAKLQSVEDRPQERRTAHHRATLDGTEARYGCSPLSKRLRDQLERWPGRWRQNSSAGARRSEYGRQLLLDAELIGPSARLAAFIGLLQHVSSGRCPSLGDVADELRLSRGEVGDPVDIAGSGTALDGAGDCLQRLLIA